MLTFEETKDNSGSGNMQEKEVLQSVVTAGDVNRFPLAKPRLIIASGARCESCTIVQA